MPVIIIGPGVCSSGLNIVKKIENKVVNKYDNALMKKKNLR